ncbi:LTA synthase family protein [Acidaminococcus intestini]|uniref:LTA synthase family protein n=2 Tax=Acidaminococcus intestini TaxID=187327 RepID=UPI001ED9F355|nr:alkaline phosphatase family protein [Acidaminococcus intestini]
MHRFLTLLQKDLRYFLYLEGLLMLFRVAFLVLFRSQLNAVSASEILYALYLGFRISLKTTVLLVGLPFLLATVPGSFSSRYPEKAVRTLLTGLSLFVMTFLFVARIPYYAIFQETYNIMLFNGMKDDMHAIWDTAVKEYQLFPRLVGVLLLSALVIHLWHRLQERKGIAPQRRVKALFAGALLFIPIFAIFCRFGGGFHSDDGIHWESAARTKSKLLNEAILDDGQALYRAYATHKRATEKVLRPLTVEEVRAAIWLLGGNGNAATIDEAFTRTKKTAARVKRPRHVVVILGENYALWPLLPSYEDMNLASTGKFLEAHGAHTYQFLANSTGTMTSLNGFVTGLPDVGLYVNYIMGKNGDPVDGLGIGAVMKKMGYRTQFWYGGLRSWQDIEKFTRREGFDEFHCADEFSGLGESSSWGIADGPFFEEVLKAMQKDEEDTFYFILTTSNHPPFAFDVDSKGFSRDRVAKKRGPAIPKDKKTLDQLGHIWYADDVMGKFIKAAEAYDPSTLFVVTGDHAERFNFSNDVSLWEKAAFPASSMALAFLRTSLPKTPPAAISRLRRPWQNSSCPKERPMNPCFPPFLIPGEPSTIAFILRMDKSAKKRTSKIRNSRQKSKRPGPLPFGESKMAMRLGQSNKRRYKSILGR